MHVLALAAVLLLALLPTFGRLAEFTRHQASMSPVTVMLCTLEGMKPVTMPLATLAQGDESPATPHHPGAGNGEDCHYCPLLASLVALAFVALGLWPSPAPRGNAIGCAGPRIAQRHPSGLGSRGPPMFSRS